MDLDGSSQARLAYLVHDLGDAAVRRRVALLVNEGFDVSVGGFKRRADLGAIMAPTVVDLGRTKDSKLARRVVTVLRHLVFPAKIKTVCHGASIIVTRNLEALMLGWRVRRPGQRLVYECLDIHRMMLAHGHSSRFLRSLERRLLGSSDLVIVSSPAFAEHYFARRQGLRSKLLLVENKFPEEHVPLTTRRVEDQNEVVVGWFGMLRCRRTLDQLKMLVAGSGGYVRVVVAGIASDAVFPNFEAELDDIAGFKYLGPYTPSDLARLYAEIDFIWSIDYFEEGLNSAWLLPNRLYEGLVHGAIPIAVRHVETGRWLARNGVGLLVDDAERDLPSLLMRSGPAERQRMRRDIAAIPKEAVYQTASERRAIVAALKGVSHAAA